jgi:hypothetical protein
MFVLPKLAERGEELDFFLNKPTKVFPWSFIVRYGIGCRCMCASEYDDIRVRESHQYNNLFFIYMSTPPI